MTIEDFNSDEAKMKLKGVFGNVRKEGEKVEKPASRGAIQSANITPKSFKRRGAVSERPVYSESKPSVHKERSRPAERSVEVQVETKNGPKTLEVKKGQILYLDKDDSRPYEIAGVHTKKDSAGLKIELREMKEGSKSFFWSSSKFLKKFDNNEISLKAMTPEAETEAIKDRGLIPPEKPKREERTKKDPTGHSSRGAREGNRKSKDRTKSAKKETLPSAPEEKSIYLNNRKLKEGESIEYSGDTYTLKKIEDTGTFDKKLHFLKNGKYKYVISLSEARKAFEKKSKADIIPRISPAKEPEDLKPVAVIEKTKPVYKLDTETILKDREAKVEQIKAEEQKKQYDILTEKINTLEARIEEGKKATEKRQLLEEKIAELEKQIRERQEKRAERAQRIAELQAMLENSTKDDSETGDGLTVITDVPVIEAPTAPERKPVAPEKHGEKKVQKFLSDFIKNNTPDFKKLFAGIENEKEKFIALKNHIVEGVSGLSVDKEFFKKALKYTLATGIMVVGNIESIPDGALPTMETKKPIEAPIPSPKTEKPAAVFNTKTESGAMRFSDIRDALEQASAKDAERIVAEAAADPRIEIADRQAYESMPTNGRIAYLINALKSPEQRTGYIIGCKENATGYAFDRHNFLVHSFPAIFGKDKSEEKNTTNSKKGKLTGATTPAGTYLFGKSGLRADQLKKYENRVFMIYGDQNGVMLHQIDSTETDFDDRIEALTTADAGDNFKSLGCMVYGKEDGNILNKTYGDSSKRFKLYFTPTDPKTVFIPKF